MQQRPSWEADIGSVILYIVSPVRKQKSIAVLSRARQRVGTRARPCGADSHRKQHSKTHSWSLSKSEVTSITNFAYPFSVFLVHSSLS
jgi:hypothetical protein